MTIISRLNLKRICLGLFVLTLLTGVVSAQDNWNNPTEVFNNALGLNSMSVEAGSVWLIRDVEVEGVGLASLKVGQVEVFAPDATVTVDNGTGTPVPDVIPETRYLRGEIDGKPGSVVALMQSPDGDLSGLMTDGNATWSIGRSSLEAPLQATPIENDAATMEKPFQCGNAEHAGLSLPDKKSILSAVELGAEPLPSGQYYQVTIAIETDYAFYALHGSAAAATSYIGNLFNYVTGIYEVELQTHLLVGNTFLWSTSSDPWVESGSTWCRLAEFGRYWRDNRGGVTRTIAHFLSGEGLGGGIAWLNALCAAPNTSYYPTDCASLGNDYVSGGFAVSANLSGTISTASDPAWDGYVVAHEIGHNFSSPHAHCYMNIGGSSSPVDACWGSESGANCWVGAVSLPGPGSLTGGTPSGRNGTIMSYCHQLSGGIVNIAGSLGLGHTDGVMAHRVADRMFGYTEAVAASNPTCIPVSGGGTPRFVDVPFSYWAWAHIESIAQAGITDGCSATHYCPEAITTRGQMAVFILRGIHGGSYYPTITPTGTVFGDVPLSHPFVAWIEQFYADGITAGCGGGNYCPDSGVTRGQMAVFLLRGKHGSSYYPTITPTGTVFGDVPLSHPFVAWIEQLASEGITSGCGGGNYCPSSTVDRAQMAVFLQRTFNFNLPLP